MPGVGESFRQIEKKKKERKKAVDKNTKAQKESGWWICLWRIAKTKEESDISKRELILEYGTLIQPYSGELASNFGYKIVNLLTVFVKLSSMPGFHSCVITVWRRICAACIRHEQNVTLLFSSRACRFFSLNWYSYNLTCPYVSFKIM